MEKSISSKILIVTFVFVFSIFSVLEVQGEVTIPLSPTGHKISGNQWLFVIGIDTYNEWPHLSTAVKDAKAVKDVLLRRYCFNEYHVIALYDEEATRRNILAKLRYLTRRVGPEDSVVVFFAGHGGTGTGPGRVEGSWIPVEGSVNDRSSWITNQEISNYLKADAIKAKHVLTIVDSCFSGSFFSGHRGRLPRVTDKLITQAYKHASRQVITSGGLKPVTVDGFSNNSVFTHFLVKGLEGNSAHFLITSGLFKIIKTGVEKSSDQIPLFGTLKDTGEQGDVGELVLCLNQDERERLKRQAKDTKVVLRSSYRALTVPEIQSMPHVDIREEMEWGFYGHSNIQHKYETKTIGYDKVVIDHATGLVWHQNGSEKFMKRDKMTEWLDDLNLHGYAGYNDWRLPTAEEAASLLEPEEKYGGLFVDTVFDKKQTWLWTGDNYLSDSVWVISTCFGSVFWSNFNTYYSIRPVRSLN
ncbi:MAG: DUF1566 domain-containing protein [Candidatus Brocadiaceae bacterium]|nr:DUF1566 domain-containing protein [Candidatus Brocadiaceae bacterium]